MPFSARDADATETFAKRATVVMVGVSGLCFKTSAAKDYGERLQQPEDCIRSVPRSRAKRKGAGDDGRDPARERDEGLRRRRPGGRLRRPDDLERRVHGARGAVGL